MQSRSISWVVFVLTGLILASPVGAKIVGWWKFDEGGGTNVADSSGNGYHGTTSGAALWVSGRLQGAMQFNGTDTYVNCGVIPISTDKTGSLSTGALSVAAWINRATSGDHKIVSNRQVVGGDGVTGGGFTCAIVNDRMEVDIEDGNGRLLSRDNARPTIPAAGIWTHLVWVFDDTANTLNLYTDGVLTSTTAITQSIGVSTQFFRIGTDAPSPGYSFSGMADDVRLYNHALTDAEIADAMRGLSPTGGGAGSPVPADKATDVARDIVLGWKPGQFARTHNVYFGTSFDDVNSANIGVLVSQKQDANTYDPAGVLEYGKTYYWRVDEVNAPPTEATVFPSATWSFTVEAVGSALASANIVAATASSSYNANCGPGKTVDGSGVNAADQHGTADATMWLSARNQKPVWIQYEFDKVYKLQQMWVWNSNQTIEKIAGFGVKTATVEYSTDGTTWTALTNVPEFARATGAADYVHNTTVDFGGVSARFVKITVTSGWGPLGQYGLSEVRFFYIPVWARQPQPAAGATGVASDATLSWRAGREAVSHQVYLGTDPNTLTLSGTAATTSYTPAGLTLGTQYYWRIDEVNAAETVSTWVGDVWNFTVSDYMPVEGFESYNDTTNCIYNVWLDGYGTGTNGALVGYDTSANSTFCETTVVHGGAQSLPFRYGQNSATTSEATRTFTGAQDWSQAGAKFLTLYFFGDPTNAAVQPYVKINGTKIVYSGDTRNVQQRRWNTWNIDLSALSAATLKSIQTLTFGVTGSGSGRLLVDDIRLYRVAPEVPVAPVNPGTTGLLAYYAMNNNTLDSSGSGNDGTLVGLPTYDTGLSSFGTAVKLNGGTDAVDLGKKAAFNPTGSFSVSLWVHSTSWTTQWGHVMMANRGDDNVGWQIRRYNTTTSLCFTTRGVGNDDMQSAAAMPQNEWVHVACVYDNVANIKRIYLNGLRDAEVTTTAGARIAATTHNTYIGARANAGNTGTEGGFIGMLDEIRVFNRALSAGEVEYLSKPVP